jgi:hypothetical protein
MIGGPIVVGGPGRPRRFCVHREFTDALVGCLVWEQAAGLAVVLDTDHGSAATAPVLEVLSAG